MTGWPILYWICIEPACCFQYLSFICIRIIHCIHLFSILFLRNFVDIFAKSSLVSRCTKRLDQARPPRPRLLRPLMDRPVHRTSVIGYKQTPILVYWVNYILKSYLNIRSIIWSHINQHHINITVTVCRTNTNFLKVSSFLHLQQVVELQHISQSLQGFAVCWRCWLHEQQAIFMQVPQEVGVLRHVRVRRLLQVFHHFVNFDFHQIRSKGLHQHDAIVKPPCFCYFCYFDINSFRLYSLFELREDVIGKHSATTFDKSLTTKS